MSADTRKIALGFAATAVVTAAWLSPLAHADVRVPLAPSDNTSSDSGTDNNSVGSSAGKARGNRGAANRPDTGFGKPFTPTTSTPDPQTPSTNTPDPQTPSTDAPTPGPDSSASTGTNPLIQNKLWWFGTPNPNPPPSTVISQTSPLADLPGWMQPSFGWFTDNNIEACVLGMGHTTVGTVGPYGTATTSVSTRGC